MYMAVYKKIMIIKLKCFYIEYILCNFNDIVNLNVNIILNV